MGMLITVCSAHSGGKIEALLSILRCVLALVFELRRSRIFPLPSRLSGLAWRVNEITVHRFEEERFTNRTQVSGR